MSHVVVDSGWELTVAKALEELPGVAAYVKNDHLGFLIPYSYAGRGFRYVPDFLVRLTDGADGITRTLIVEVSGGAKRHHSPGPVSEKADTTRHLWVPRSTATAVGGCGTTSRSATPRARAGSWPRLWRSCAAPAPSARRRRASRPKRWSDETQRGEGLTLAAKPQGPTPVDAITHEDKRVNIPTADAYDFVDEGAARPGRCSTRATRRSTRNWCGRARTTRTGDLEVDAPPIYIQEKLDPRVLIENLRRTAERPQDEPELTLFETFDGLEGLETVDFYKHAANWSNRMILGDSLQVMASLAEREHLRSQVQMIYVDPPYGIKFGSNWQVSTRKRDVKDGKVEDATREVEQIKAFRDTWELGIHSYLSYLRDRLTVARDLLTESGSVFVQIGDENVHLVRAVMDEVFGSENFVSQITFKKTSSATSDLLAGVAD